MACIRLVASVVSLIAATPFALYAQDAVSAASDGAERADVTVVITDLDPLEGEVMVALYADEESYARFQRYVGDIADADATEVSFEFTGLPPGRYVVGAIHDVDENGRLNYDEMGAPTEDYCFSNDAHGVGGPPDFTAASTEIAAGSQEITLSC